MRLSSLILASLLLAPPALLAQHPATGGSSSGGSSSSSSSNHSSTSSGGASSSASSGGSHSSPSAGSSHSGSSGSSSSASHSAGSHTSAGSAGSASGHSSIPGSHNSNAAGTDSHSSVAPLRSVGEASRPATSTIRQPATGRVATKETGPSTPNAVQPEKRGFFSFLRHPFRRPEPKPAEPDLRRRICLEGPCKEPEQQPPQADLRHRICTNGPCVPCPPGQSAGKNGKCFATPPVNTALNQCGANENWNGSVCVANNHCRVGTRWDGIQCVDEQASACASINARAAMLANELRGIKAEMRTACTNNPPGQQCGDLKLSYDGAVARYRMLLNEAPIACRPMLPDPLSL